MKLHDAIDSVLAEHPDGLTAKDLARQINRRKLYVKPSDGKKVPPGQIAARVGNKTYRERYRRDDLGRITKRGMPATAYAVRVYWSDHHYGKRPRETPSDEPIVIEGFPASGDLCSVWFGRVPDELREQIRTRVAMGNMMLNAGFGGVTRAGDEGVEDEIAKEPLGFEDHAWYITIAVARSVEVDETKLTGSHYMWIDPRAIERVQHGLSVDAQRAFEAVVATIAPTLEGAMFEGHEMDHVWVTAPGLGPAFMPQFTGSGRGVAGRSMESFPLELLQERLPGLGASEQWHTLGNATHWYEVMLSEREDPLRRFLWGFISLEVLTNELLRRLDRPTFVALREAVDPTRRVALPGRFALVANELSPETAHADIDVFEKLYRARNDIAHGGRRLREKDPPSEDMRALLPRYLTLALSA
jgi:hypothetical protein